MADQKKADDKSSPWMDLTTFLRDHAESKPLSEEDRELIVDTALVLFQDVYAHLPLKEALHGVAPLQRLKILRRRIPEIATDLEFHREVKEIFTSVRDAHTSYHLPSPYKEAYAFLPFTVKAYWEGGDDDAFARTVQLSEEDRPEGLVRRYLVTNTRSECEDRTPDRPDQDRFQRGVRVVYWNGVPIERAVQLNAERHPGSNLQARHARGVASLTARPMVRASVPDEEWVTIRYNPVKEDGEIDETKELEFTQTWLVYYPVPPEDKVRAEEDSAKATALGLDEEGETIGEVSYELFAGGDASTRAKKKRVRRDSWPGEAFRDEFGMEVPKPLRRENDQSFPPLDFIDGIVPTPDGKGCPRGSVTDPSVEIETILPKLLQARAVTTTGGTAMGVDVGPGTFGYIRIRSFNARDSNLFISEFVRLASMLPQNGLIIDVRNNPGGMIDAGERLLQVLTHRKIEPSKSQFIATPLMRRLCDLNSESALGDTQIKGLDLDQWTDALDQADRIGARWSRGFPINSVESCNAIGQKYHGPIVLITNARCYSTTDFFAAGFQDHGIGCILGTDDNTGAGGGNVWSERLIGKGLGETDNPLAKRLPHNASMRVTIRRSLRVGPNAETPLEDLGVKPDLLYWLTRRDLLEKGADLINVAGAILSANKEELDRELYVKVKRCDNDGVHLMVETLGLERVAVTVDDHPPRTFAVKDGVNELLVHAETAHNLHHITHEREVGLVGFGKHEVEATRNLRRVPFVTPEDEQ